MKYSKECKGGRVKKVRQSGILRVCVVQGVCVNR